MFDQEFFSKPHPYFLSNREFHYTGWLYKYMSNMDYIKNAIKTKTLYLSHPSDFNDPFDAGFVFTPESVMKISCPPSLLLRLIGDFLYDAERSAILELIQKGDLPRKIQDIIDFVISKTKETKPYNTMIYMLFRRNDYMLSGTSIPKVRFDERLKIFCFSQTRNSFPMWAHYANNHKGVCLGYDAKNIQLSAENDIPPYALNTVQYTDHFITDDIENYNHAFYKSDQWAYEKEVRIVCQMDGNVLRFPYLKEVSLGINMPQKERAELIDLCLDNGVDVLQAEISDSGNYDLSFVQGGDILTEYHKRGIDGLITQPSPVTQRFIIPVKLPFTQLSEEDTEQP